MNKLKKGIIGTFNWLRFSFSVAKGIFGGNSPELVLKIIELFVVLEAPLYKKSMYFGRSMADSTFLLQSLIGSYLETKSSVTLNQIMTVLKEEIIEREQKHGREQFPSRPFRGSNT